MESPPPDALLLELIDLVALSFPKPVQSAVVSFVPSPDGRTPALTNLAGNAPADGPDRPDLGHGDTFVLDAIQATLVDLMGAVEARAQTRVSKGRVEWSRDAGDGALHVLLVDESASERVRMTRRFDVSEQRWLFFSPALFAALNETAEQERAAAVRLDELLLGATRFRIDMERGRITFVGGDAPSFRMELLGSWSEGAERFLWGWANENAPPALRAMSESVRAASDAPGLRAFVEPDLGCPLGMAERLARHAGVRAGARGVYRAPFASDVAKGVLFLAILDDA